MKYFLALILSIISCSCSTTPDEKPLPYGCPGGPKQGIKPGRVVLLIDVGVDGKAKNIRVSESDPKGMWDAEALCIVKRGVFINNDKGQNPPFKDHKVFFTMRLVD